MRYRRRSSATIPIKPGNYGINRPISFAPNLTPVTFTTEDELTPLEGTDSVDQLFPPSAYPPNPPARKRCPPGKRRSQGYIPRPPNAFMLFRADFVRQKHVPGSIETNHGSLSKIIGNCWRSLPLEEKRIWEIRAKQEKAAHKVMYPDYRFRPVHNKNKEKKKDRSAISATEDDERRCEEVAALLLEGKKGEELAVAVRNLDLGSASTSASCRSSQPPLGPMLVAPVPLHYHRRSSSVPPMQSMDFYNPNPYTIQIPSAPILPPLAPRPSQMWLSSRASLGHRRASSAMQHRDWSLPQHWYFDQSPPPQELARDPSPLPDVDPNIFADFSFSGVDMMSHSVEGIAPHEAPPSAPTEMPVWYDSTSTVGSPDSADGGATALLGYAPLPPVHDKYEPYAPAPVDYGWSGYEFEPTSHY